MSYSETDHSQLRQGPLSEPHRGAVRSAAFEAADGGLSISERLKILSGDDYGVHSDADMLLQPYVASDLGDDLEADWPIRKLCRTVLWHCECLYYQMAGPRVAEQVHLLKQRLWNLPGPAKAEVSYR